MKRPARKLKKSLKTSLIFAFLGTLLLYVHWAVSSKLYRPSLTDEEFLQTAPLVNLDTRLLDILTFGHRGLYDDLITIWMLQVVMDPRILSTPPERLLDLLIRVGRHQPQIESFYLLGCFVLAFDLKRPDLCEPILKIGTSAFPTRWRIPVTMGVIAAHYLNDREKAQVYYQIASQRPMVPEYIKATASRLAREKNMDFLPLEQNLEMILGHPQDPVPSTRPSRLMEMLQRRHEKP